MHPIERVCALCCVTADFNESAVFNVYETDSTRTDPLIRCIQRAAAFRRQSARASTLLFVFQIRKSKLVVFFRNFYFNILEFLLK